MNKHCIFICIIALFTISNAWFAVPCLYWDANDSLTYYFALGFGDTAKYGAAEIRYAPKSKATRAEFRLDLPLMGTGTEIYGRYTNAETFDPRKLGEDGMITVQDTTQEPDTSISVSNPKQTITEYQIRLHQHFKAGIESFWGIFVDYRQGKYLSDYEFQRIQGETPGFFILPETTEAQIIGGGISFGYDTREGDFDPEAGYLFSIETGANYLLQDTLEADYVRAGINSPKVSGFILIDQFIYTPTSALPVDIPLLTVQAPTIIGIRTSGAYYTGEVPQLIAINGSDYSLFRGLPPRKRSGYAFFLLVGDIRISPITRMYTPMTLVHLLAPRTIPDIRADLEIIPSVDIGKIFYGEKSVPQFYTWGLGLGLKFSKKLTTRFDVLWTPRFDNYVTTYFSIRQPF